MSPPSSGRSAAPPASRLLLATRKGLLILDRVPTSSTGWSVTGHHFQGARVSYACRDPRTDTLWACLDHGHWGVKLHRSRDGGGTWDEVPLAYPDGEMEARGPNEADGDVTRKPAATKYAWVLQPGPASQPGRLYCGTEPGGLFVSDDDGDTWTLNRGLWDHPSRVAGQWFGGGRDSAAIHSICIHPEDPDHLWVGVSVAGVFETVDGGVTWTPRNLGQRIDFLPPGEYEVGADPHHVVLHPRDPSRLWQQNHCGVYRSDDGAATWVEVGEADTDVHFGFPIGVDAEDPDVAWVVPAISDEDRRAIDGALAVWRTEDAGASWQRLDDGLPQADCHDVVFRHALDVRGDVLAMGSTTGNLWVSSDRGDSWVSLGQHLPPIASVRFA